MSIIQLTAARTRWLYGDWRRKQSHSGARRFWKIISFSTARTKRYQSNALRKPRWSSLKNRGLR